MTATPEPSGFWRPFSMRELTRALPAAVAWAYVTAILGAVLLAAVGLLSFGVYGARWILDRSRPIADPAWAAVATAAWVAGPVAVGGAVWGATYAATISRSVPRAILGTGVAVGVGAALLALDASGFAVAALAMGWSLAIPADRMGRAGLRGLVPLAAAIAVRGWSWGSVAALAGWRLGVVVGVSPILAAAWVWVADALWTAVVSSRHVGASTTEER